MPNILLVTSKEDKQDVIQGLESGRRRLFDQAVFPENCTRGCEPAVGFWNFEDKLVAASDVLQYKATHDELTGLLNRASISDLLRRELGRTKRKGESVLSSWPISDHFKLVNDGLGHAAGDAVLCEAARRLTASVRPYDAVGRYGGEEFLIVLPGCDASSLRQRAENILENFHGKAFAHSIHLFP